MHVHLPNILTFLRLVLAPALIIFLIIDKTDSAKFLGMFVFIVIIATDFFDGYLARKYNAVTQIGEILDPIADKILIVFILFALSVNLTSYYIAFMSSLIISREIWVGALRDFNARHNNTKVTKVTFIAKTKTSLQLFTISIYLLGLALDKMLLVLFGDMFLFLSLLLTIYSGYIYTIKSFKT